MKKFFLSLVAAFTAFSVYADEVTATFALTSGAAETATVSAENVFSGTSTSIGGSRLAFNGTKAYDGVTYTLFRPSSKSNLNEDYVRFALTPKKGITFVPTKVSFGACRFGTDAGNFKVLVNSTEVGSCNSVGRNTAGKENDGYVFGYTIDGVSCESTSPCYLDVYIETNASKDLGLVNFVVEGTYSGEAEEEVMYTISASVNIDGAGTIAQDPAGTSIVEKNPLTFTATANTGYKFVNWTDALGEILSSTADYSIASVEANVGVIANFVALPKVTFAKAGEELGNVPAVVYCEVGAEVVLPKNQTLYKEGSTFSGWSDGENLYAAGAAVTVNGDVTLTAVYAENTVALAETTEDIVANWTFAREEGAPTLNCENSEAYYVNQVTVNGVALDLSMYVNTKDNAFVDGKRGKLNNTANAAYAQVNVGTGFTIPAVSGMVIQYVCSSAPADNTGITFGGELGEVTENTVAYTYAGEAATITIADVVGGLYPKGIVVTYPAAEVPFSPVDCTASVDVNGWKSDIGNVGSYTKDVAQKEQYNGSTAATLGDVLYQTVEGLANGTYTVELYANASSTGGRDNIAEKLANSGELGRVVVYAGDVEKTIPAIIQTAVAENNIVTLENVVVSDGTLKMGLRKDVAGTNWHTIQIKSLTQTSNEANANAAAQDEYWKGIAATVAAYEAYANVAGVEKAAIAAAETKAAAQATIAPFYAAKSAYDALVQAIADADAVGVDAADAKAVLASAETTAATATEALHLVKLAVNTSKATEGADMTFVIVNPSFENGTTGWTYATSNDHGAKENSNGTYTMTNCDGNYLFNIWSSGNAISQKIEDLPNGTYLLKAVIATDGGHQVQLNANDQSVQIDAVDKGTGVEGELEFKVLDNTATIGAEGVDKYWYKVDNFRLTFVKGFDLSGLITAYDDALAEANAIEGVLNRDVQSVLAAAIAAEVDKTDADALTAATATLTEAVAAAKASVAAYTDAEAKLADMKELVDATNFYTAEALANYYTQWEEKFMTRTLTTDEANSLMYASKATGWRAENNVDDLLMSTWDETVMNWASYHVNTWSNEGDTDGSNFRIPFIEYWTGDGESLAEKTLTATMNGVAAGNYTVSAWVRVRIKNDAEAPATGITFQANDGEAVNVADGTQVGESQFYLKEVTANATVGEDGVLTAKFIVAADNNISWLAFKNVKFEEAEEPVVTYPTEIVNPTLAENADGWTISSNAKAWSDGVIKFGSGTTVCDFSQTIALNAGTYVLKANAAYRAGASEQDEYNAIAAGAETHLAKLYAIVAGEKVTANVKNRYEGALDAALEGVDGQVTLENNKVVPNSSAAVKAYFDAGQYVNELIFTVADSGNVTIGIEKAEAYADGDYLVVGGGWSIEPYSAVADIELTLESGADIATALAEAVAGKALVGDITINLAEGGAYTVSSSLEPTAGTFAINGNGATIDASALASAFINYASVTGEIAKKDDGTDSKYTIVENVTIQGVKIAGLSQSLINNGAGNVLFNKVLVDNSVVEIIGSNAIFALGQGYPEDLKVTNSTLWSKDGHTGFLFQAHGKAIDIKADNKTSWTVDKSTLYQIAKGKKANNTNTFKGKTYLVLTLTNSLLYDFGSNTGNEVNGWLFGQNSTSPTITYSNNAYLNADGVVAGWTDETKGGSDQTGTSIAGVVTFTDAANGNFNGVITLAEGSTLPESLGDPRWTISEPVEMISGTVDFQDLCMALGKGGPWAVNDGGDAGFTVNDAEMHYLGDYADQGFVWGNRFAYEYVADRGKFTVRNKNNKKDKNCGIFSWDYAHNFSILGLKDGDKVTVTTLAGTTTFVSTNVTEEVAAGATVESDKTYTIKTEDETTRLDLNLAAATLISKITIELYGVETVPTISVDRETLALIAGASQKLVGTVDPASAAAVWSSDNEAVATVAEDGTVTAVAAGTANISLSWKSETSDAVVTASCAVTVADIDFEQYEIAKTYDFSTMGDIALTLSEEAAGAIWNAANNTNNDVFFCTNEGLENIAVQAAGASDAKGWSIVNGQGLFLGTGAGRCAAVGGITAGQIVEFIYTGADFYTKSDDAGINKTALNEATGRAIYKAEEDGMIGFELVKGNYVSSIVIYQLKSTDGIETLAADGEQEVVFNLDGTKAVKANGMGIVNGKVVFIKK